MARLLTSVAILGATATAAMAAGVREKLQRKKAFMSWRLKHESTPWILLLDEHGASPGKKQFSPIASRSMRCHGLAVSAPDHIASVSFP